MKKRKAEKRRDLNVNVESKFLKQASLGFDDFVTQFLIGSMLGIQRGLRFPRVMLNDAMKNIQNISGSPWGFLDLNKNEEWINEYYQGKRRGKG